MSKINAICPVCGCVNKNVDLDETEGWAECCKCETVFMATPVIQRFCKPKPDFFALPAHTSNS